MPQDKYPDDEFQKKPVISASQLLGGGSSDNFGSYESAPIQSEARPVKQANEWMQPMNAPTEYAQAKPENQFMEAVSIPTEAKPYPSIQSEARAIKPENQFMEQVEVPTERYPTAAPLLKGAAPKQGSVLQNIINRQIETAKAAQTEAQEPKQERAWQNIINRQIETAKAKAQEPKQGNTFQNIINRQIETAKAKAQEPKQGSVLQNIINRQIETAKAKAQEPKQERAWQNIINRQIETAKAAQTEAQEPKQEPKQESMFQNIINRQIKTAQEAAQAEQEKLSLTDTGALTTGGQFVEDETLRGLQTGEFAGIQSQENRTDRNRAARDYMINKSARERAANSGFAPGSKQYQDIMAQAQSEIASGNLAGEQALNQATRDEFQEYMNRAAGIETERFGRAVGERGFKYQREDIEYLRGEQDKIHDKSDAQSVINNIKDQKAKQELLKALTDGGINGFKAKLNDVIGEGGTIAEKYRSASTIDTMFQEAEEWVERLNPKRSGELKAVWKARNAKAIQDRVKEIDTAKRQPLKAATDLETAGNESDARIATFISSGDASGLEEDDWKNITDTQKVNLKASGAIQVFESLEGDGQLNDGFPDGKPMSSAEAKKAFQDANPWAKAGNIVEKNGTLYKIIRMDSRSSSGNWRRAQVIARPVKGGAEVSIFNSNEYDP